MAEKVKIDIDAVINTGDSLQKLRDLKKAQREVVAGSAEFNKLAAAIRDTGDALESSAMSADDLKGTLEGAPGPVGQLFKGLKQVELATKSWGFALKATGIGLIVSLVGTLIAAFSKTEDSMKKMEPLFIAFEQLFQGIVDALQPAIEQFTQLALDVMPLVTSAFKYVYSAIGALLQSIGKVGEAIGKLFKGDFKGAWESAKESVTQFGDNFTQNVDNFEKGTKKMTKTQKENLKEQEDAAKKALEEKIKRMEAEDKLDEARLKKLKEEALTLAQTEQEKLDVERRFAELAQQARLKDLDDKMALYKKDSLEYKTLQADKINAEADYVSQLRGFTETQNKINEEAAKKALEEAKKKAEIERGIRLSELQAKLEDLDRENKLYDYDFEQDLERLAQQRDILRQQEETELSNEELNEFQKTEIRKKFADARLKITDQEIETERAAKDAKLAIQEQYIDLYAQFGQLLGQIAGKNKALAIAGLLIEKGAAVAKIITQMNTVPPILPPGIPNPAFIPSRIGGALSIASVIAASVQGIKQINEAGAAAGVSGGGGGAVGAPPAFASPQGMSIPQVQTTPGATPQTQLAATIGTAQDRPIKAYVVSQDISSNQALDRRTNGAATFGG